MPDYLKSIIYKIECTVARLIYIGSSTRTLGVRSGEHINMAKVQNRPLYNAIREIGAENFGVRIIDTFPCANKFHLEQREFEIIKAYPRDSLYNVDVEPPVCRPDTGLNPKYQRGKIYAVVNNVNGMVYVGSTIQPLANRLSFHKQQAKGVGSPLYVAMREYGIKNFVFSIVERYPCASELQLERREMEIMKQYPSEILLNTTIDGVHSQASKDKMSIGCSKANKLPPVVSTAVLLDNVPRKEALIRESRGCIYDAKGMSVWRFEWTDAFGKTKTKNASYNGNKATRTSEEAYLICLDAQNKLFPPEVTPDAP